MYNTIEELQNLRKYQEAQRTIIKEQIEKSLGSVTMKDVEEITIMYNLDVLITFHPNSYIFTFSIDRIIKMGYELNGINFEKHYLSFSLPQEDILTVQSAETSIKGVDQ